MVEAKTTSKPAAAPKAKATKAPAKEKAPATEKKAPAPRVPKTPEQKQSYTKGVSCGRGKHKWVDKGTYFKCEGGENPLCRSTKTKHPAKAPAAKKEETPGATHAPSFSSPGLAARVYSPTAAGRAVMASEDPAAALAEAVRHADPDAPTLPDGAGVFFRPAEPGEEFYTAYSADREALTRAPAPARAQVGQPPGAEGTGVRLSVVAQLRRAAR